MSLAMFILSSILTVTPVTISDSPMVNGLSVSKPVIIYITGSISENGAERFANDMRAAEATGQSIIPIVISSYGGSVYSMLKMIDVIEKSPTRIATIVNGKAMSAGAVLFSCGDEGLRFISKHSTVMIHEVSSGSRGKAGEIKASADETKRLNELMLSIMSKNIGEHSNFILNMIHQKGHADWFLNANDTLEIGLANKIGMPDLITRINVGLYLE